MARTTYTAEQVTRALMQLVANAGNSRKTSEELIDDEFMVSESLLRSWKNDTHAEQYRRLEEKYGEELEAEAVNQARLTVQRVAELERQVVEKIGEQLDDGKIDTRDLPATLRSLTDTKAKSIDRVLSLTGRPRDPSGPSGNDVVALVEGMAAKGLIRLAVAVEAGPALPEQRADHGDHDAGDDGDRERLNP